MRIALVITAVFVLMALETRLSRAHERTLRARGALEPAGDVYGLMQAIYPLAFLMPAVEGWLTRANGAPLWIAGLIVWSGAKALKYWAMATLGERWTFKVLVPPGSSRIRTGPYALLSHPNYIAVAGEILGAALLMGGERSGLIFTILFSCLMLRRIHIEERSLS